jgi:hypothetical protein
MDENTIQWEPPCEMDENSIQWEPPCEIRYGIGKAAVALSGTTCALS